MDCVFVPYPIHLMDYWMLTVNTSNDLLLCRDCFYLIWVLRYPSPSKKGPIAEWYESTRDKSLLQGNNLFGTIYAPEHFWLWDHILIQFLLLLYPASITPLQDFSSRAHHQFIMYIQIPVTRYALWEFDLRYSITQGRLFPEIYIILQ